MLARTAVVFVLLFSATATAWAQSDVVATGRRLAAEGRHAEAGEILTRWLDERPADADARTLLGMVLLWQGDEEGARRELTSAVANNPANVEAVTALIDVELRTGHVAEAEEFARQALVARPAHVPLLVLHGRALQRLGRRRDARTQLDAAVRIAPGNDEALRVRQQLQPERPVTFGGRFGSEKLGEDLPWKETSVQIGYHSAIGPFNARRTRAERSGLREDQYELQIAPQLGSRTRASLEIGYAQDGVLFPDMRYALDVYRSVGAGFELSLGARRLEFADSMNVYTAAMNKYYGNWQFLTRAYFTPDGPGTSGTYQVGLRRIYGPGGGSAFGVRYSYGSSPDDIRDVADLDIRKASVVIGDMDSRVTRWFGMTTRASYGWEDVAGADGVVMSGTRLSVSTALFLRF